MTSFEFLTKTYFTTFDAEGKSETPEQAFAVGANKLGSEGWDIISILPAATQVGFTVFFRREKPESECTDIAGFGETSDEHSGYPSTCRACRDGYDVPGAHGKRGDT